MKRHPGEPRRLYVAGPMTGIPLYNYPAFETAREKYTARGYDVQTPFDCNSRVWERHYGKPFNPGVDKCDYGDPLLLEMMDEDIRTCIHAHTIVFLEGWIRSRGGRMECVIAHTAGKKLIDDSIGRYFTIEYTIATTIGEAA